MLYDFFSETMNLELVLMVNDTVNCCIAFFILFLVSIFYVQQLDSGGRTWTGLCVWI